MSTNPITNNYVPLSFSSQQSSSKHKVVYFYDESIGDFNYGDNHCMKPLRLKMTHELIHQYDLLQHMEVIRPIKITNR